jgi:hypothetical protein
MLAFQMREQVGLLEKARLWCKFYTIFSKVPGHLILVPKGGLGLKPGKMKELYSLYEW